MRRLDGEPFGCAFRWLREYGETKPPSVEQARALGQFWGADRVIVLHVTGDRMGYVSWGRTRGLCRDTRRLADLLYDAACGSHGAEWGGR